ncbi:MAG: HEAT repeat domain-containing protein [Phycisphaerae bacterium]|nr:HEAT repeat domain-containing protein [Phycisphaerae bacterium]MDW8261059.1 HEAT repeat domain-containing protein [Phycisphaerales bacterium]
MIDRLVNALVESRNQAADDTLLEALRVGNEQEQTVVLAALFRRKTVYGLSGVIRRFADLPERLQRLVLAQAPQMHQALRESGRSDERALKIAAMKLIALSRQGALAHILGENLHDKDEAISRTACEAITALARWVATETRRLQREGPESDPSSVDVVSYLNTIEPSPRTPGTYEALIANRPEIEATVVRALDAHRGRHGQDLLRAALLLCDSSQSKVVQILHGPRHAGQSPMIRRLQQPPAAEHVAAFLVAGSHGQVRSHFGQVFAHIVEAPVLDAILRYTHLLKDHQLQICMHLVSRGAWWDEKELARDLERRTPQEAARIGEWLAASQIHDVLQDEKLEKLRQHAAADPGARLRLLRIAMRRKRGASVALIRSFLNDPDERLARLAAREIVRRRPPDFENLLLPLMTAAPLSVRKVVSRAVGHVGFEQFWERFDSMDRATRRQAGKAMLKLLPDGLARLARRLDHGSADTRIKALQVISELDLSEPLKDSIIPLARHANARVRSKAIALMGSSGIVPPDVLLERALRDADPRVRANAIEALDATRHEQLLPLLTERARSNHNRERANAIRALYRVSPETARTALLAMLSDPRSEHRVSALWAMRQLGLWQLVQEVGRLAREDTNMRVRRYALGVIRALADLVQQQKSAAAATTIRKAG